MSEVKWTKEQLQAIREDRNNVLVAAAAGSGKTAVLVERMINKIIHKNVDIDKILVVTFTNAAASEMRERILEAIYQKMEEEPNNPRLAKQITLLSKANICTIDSFCLDVVKNNFYEIGIAPNFRIADTAELELLKQETIEDLFEEKYEKRDDKFLALLETYSTYLSDDNLKDLIFHMDNFIQSSPFPKDWLNQKIEEFNLNEKLEQDFSQNQWGKIIIKNIKEETLDCKLKLEKILKDISKYSELEKYRKVIQIDINMMDQVLKQETWDELYQVLNEISFEKWPVDKKITIEEKNIAKDKRDKIKKQFSKAIEIMNCSSKEANTDIAFMYQTLNNLKELVFEFEQLFAQNKEEKNIVDFSDIEHFALNILLQKNEAGEYIPTQTAKKYREKFNEIAIDEYQDSNLVQEYILKSISNGKNMFMVGDVKQSIYKFRQACPELFLQKYDHYELAKEETVDENKTGIKIQLFKNFRSRENILDTTNLIFDNIMSKKLGDIDYNENEYLNLGASFEESEEKTIAENTQVFIIENSNEQTEEILEEPIENIELEAKFTANKIKELIDSKEVVWDKKVGYRAITYKDIVILLRATKERANVFEKEITKQNMPVFSDTSAEYLDSIEIQTIISLLKIIDNPMQDIPLVTVLRSFIGGFSDNELIKIRLETGTNKTFYESMKEYILPYSKSEELRMNNEEYKICKTNLDVGADAPVCPANEEYPKINVGNDAPVVPKTNDVSLQNKIQTFLTQIQNWQQENEYLNLDEFIWKIYEETGYYAYVGLMPNGLLKQANLKSLFEKAKQYEKASFKGLYNFIHFIDRLKTTSGDLSAAKLIGENENVIRIMSIHKSKGLEFPVVFLCGSNKQFNLQDLNSPVLLHQNLGIGVSYIDAQKKLQYNTLSKEAIKIITKEELLSEEMRVLYVALTRAKERLFITGVSKEIEKELREKEELLELYSEEKINKNILKKYKSYLDWIELVALKNKNNNIFNLNMINKNDIIGVSVQLDDPKNLENDSCTVVPKEQEKMRTPNDLHQELKKINKENINNLKQQLEWKYQNIEASKIESKTSVSKIKSQMLDKENTIQLTTTPHFLKEEQTLTGAQKGTVIHLCMQNLIPGKEYTLELIQKLIENLRLENKITNKEYESVNIKKIEKFTKSFIWKELKKAKLVEQEKTFYINLAADSIYHNGIQDNILVQGIIDLYYINEKDELILVDYKTDYVQNENELKEKYKTQLEIYKQALEKTYQRKVKKVYIYSTQLEKEIEITG